MATPQCANQRWSIDFVSDALAGSRRFRILAVVDDFSRECLALITDNSISGIRRARTRPDRRDAWETLHDRQR
jgi:putative transposase